MCVHCSRPLSWYENIPVFSFLWLKGKCRTCKGKIPSDYFLVELITGFIVVILGWHYSNMQFDLIRFIRDFIFVMLLVVVFVYDLKYQIILSGVAWTGAVIGFIFNHFYLGISTHNLLLGFVLGGGFFLIQYVISRGRWIGGGDVRLGAMMEIWLGWSNILFALFVSYILGALVSVPLLITKKQTGNSQIPFGTFLSLGTVVAMYWGDKIVGWYLSLIK